MTLAHALQRQRVEEVMREKYRLTDAGVARALQCYDGAPLPRQAFTYSLCVFESPDSEKACRTWLRQIGALEAVPAFAQQQRRAA